MRNLTFIRLFLILSSILILLTEKKAFGQSKSDSTATRTSGFAQRAQQMIGTVAEKSRTKYEDERVALGQQQVLNQIEKEIRSAKLFISSELDTSDITSEINKAKECFNVVKEDITFRNNRLLTHRNLTISSTILTQLLSDVNERKTQVDKMTKQLSDHRYRLDSMSTDTLLYTLSSDSATIMTYIQKLMILNLTMKPVDSLIDKGIIDLKIMKSSLDPLVFDLNLELERVESEKDHLATKLFSRELPNLWNSTNLGEFRQAAQLSLTKEVMAFQFYLANYVGSFLILFCAWLICYAFLRSLRSFFLDEEETKGLIGGTRVLAKPLAASILIVISLFQFIFLDPPFIISFVFWVLSIISLTLIFRGYINRYWLLFWLVMATLFLIACLTNLLLQASTPERWIILVLSIIGLVYGSKVLRAKQFNLLKERYILYAIYFLVTCQFFAVFFNVWGRYNLSKTLMVGGYVGLIIAILFLWAVRMIDEVLRLANSVYKSPDRKLFYVNFDKLGDRSPTILYVLLCFGWLILVGRNYFEFKQLIRPVNLYITETRTIGSYDFTIHDLLLFVGISGAAVILSRLVSFFATEPGIHASNRPNTATSIAANWLLLIRIVIITAGILLAFAASGIALDRLTIIIGALGVGIGLGLQNLVTNLVSGLIIAFERPISVGDQVEVNAKSGVMKSVGFRSSIITLVDGACMIVPNGDLLGQHLINWTMGKGRKRLTLTFGVAYGTDLALVKQLIIQLLSDNDNIMAHPLPVVNAKDFASSSIDFELIFWVKNMDQASSVRDAVILQIDTIFRNHSIVIPFPQHDIRLTNLSEINKNTPAIK